VPTDEIAAEIVHQLRGRISERRIYECLEDEQYAKYKKKHRVENARKRQGRKDQAELAAEPQLKEEIAVQASGQETVLKPTHSPQENLVKTQGEGSGSGIDTGTSPPQPEQGARTGSELSEKEREDHRKCKKYEVLQQKYEQLQSKLQGYEELVRTRTSIKTAKELYRSSDGYQQFEFSVPFEQLRQHMIAPFNSNRSMNRVWFTGKFNHETGEVVDVRIGKTIDADTTEIKKDDTSNDITRD
jgi:hypothetical protein